MRVCARLCAVDAELLHAQAAALAAAEQSPPVRLIVIDSITNPFRELDAACAEDMAHRSRLLYQLACLLKETAHRRVPRARIAIASRACCA